MLAPVFSTIYFFHMYLLFFPFSLFEVVVKTRCLGLVSGQHKQTACRRKASQSTGTYSGNDEDIGQRRGSTLRYDCEYIDAPNLKLSTLRRCQENMLHQSYIRRHLDGELIKLTAETITCTRPVDMHAELSVIHLENSYI